MKYRAIISDFDGTLVYSDPNLSHDLIQTIQEYINNGGKFCIATGRGFSGDILKACQDLQLTTPQIANGGAEIINPISGEVLIGQYISGKIAEEVLKRFLKEDLRVLVSQGGLVFTKEPDPNSPYFLEQRVLSKLEFHTISKIRLTVHPEQLASLQPLIEEVVAQYPHDLIVLRSDTIRNVGFDITSPKATKHLAVLELAKMLSLEPGNIAGMGDGYNDYPLLTACGYKVAMNSAPAELLEIADYIAPTEGAAVAIKHIESLI